MKLLLLVIVVVGFVQICSSAAILKKEVENDDSDKLTDDDIERIRSKLNTIPGANPKTVKDFSDILLGYRANSTETEVVNSTLKLLGLALNADLTKLNTIIHQDSSSSEEIDAKGSSEEGLTVDDLKEMELELSKVLTSPEQLEHAMRILRGFKEGATSAETGSAVADLFTSAIRGAFNLPDKEKQMENNEKTEFIDNNAL